MNPIGQPERATQNRVVALFRDELGYRYLGDWSDRYDNSNVEEDLLSRWLTQRGHTPPQISAALHMLRTEADNPNRTLYGNIVDELEPAGYSSGDVRRIQDHLDNYLDVREIIRRASGESLDLKAYEADMRHLIDTFIHADEPTHNARFGALMRQFMPQWEHVRRSLNRLPVGHADWGC